MSSTSTDPKVFRLTEGQTSAGLARDRLWQVPEGSGRLRFVVDGQVVGDMPIPESGWFVVPESNRLRVQLVAESALTFESKLPLALVPRLGDLGRAQLIQPIRTMLSVIGVDDSAVDWSVKLAQPSFRLWFGESLDQALARSEPMSPDIQTPLIPERPVTALDDVITSEVTRAIPMLVLAALLALSAVVSLALGLAALESPAFGLSSMHALVVGASVIWVLMVLWSLDQLEVHYRDVQQTALAVSYAAISGLLFWRSPALAFALFVLTGLIVLAYWIYVRRLLPGLPAIDHPMRWLSMRLARDGEPSVRARVLKVWDEASQWVVARIELVAEYSRFSRAVVAAGLVLPAMASADATQPMMLTGLSLASVLILERLRSALPVEVKDANPRTQAPVKPLTLRGDVQFDAVVYRRHAGDQPLFKDLSFECPAESLVRITAAEGAGLSTLKHLLIRRVNPERGAVRIGGMDVARLDPVALAVSVVMLDHPRDSEARTVGDWLFIDPAIQSSTLEAHLDALGASHWIETLSGRLQAPVGALQAKAGPLGMHRLKLARALARPGQVLWFDHWLVGLDQAAREYVLRMLAERPGTRFVVDRDGFLVGRATRHWEVGGV